MKVQIDLRTLGEIERIVAIQLNCYSKTVDLEHTRSLPYLNQEESDLEIIDNLKNEILMVNERLQLLKNNLLEKYSVPTSEEILNLLRN